jgi:hypothetical protein
LKREGEEEDEDLALTQIDDFGSLESHEPATNDKNALISRAEVLSGLTIAERRMPQDGAIDTYGDLLISTEAFTGLSF